MRTSKTKILACVMAGIMATSMTACTKSQPRNDLYVNNAYQGSGQVESNFFGLVSPKHIVDALKNVNLFESFDDYIAESKKTGGRIRTERIENNADSTAIETYYLGKQKICAVYEGYGEESWEMYTNDIDGTRITVKYTDQGTDNASVSVLQDVGEGKGLSYDAYYIDLDKSLPYGAKQIFIGFEETKDDFLQDITYSLLYDGTHYNCSLANAYYTDPSGNYCYSYYDEEENKAVTRIISERIKSTNVELFDKFDFGKVAALPGFKSFETIVGRHENFTDENGAIYIRGDLYCVFDSKQAAAEFAGEYGLANPDDDYAVDCFSVKIEDAMLKVAADCRADTKDYTITQFLTADVDDPEFHSMRFNTSNEIYRFDNERFLSCN